MTVINIKAELPMKTNIIITYVIVLVAMIVMSCSEERIGPTLPGADEFTPPVIANAATADEKVFTSDMVADEYEKFEWAKPAYGNVPLSTTYTLEVDDDNDFSSPVNLFETSTLTAAEITVGKFNDALLALGLPPNQKATVNIRVRSTITGQASDTLFSNVIKRTVTNFKAGDCGNFCTVGIIGSATPGGWNVDTDMHLLNSATDKFTWTATLYLSAGDVKFRASDAWTTNWGSSDFPSGTGVQDGSNITIPTAGYYKVIFNDVTGAYSLTELSAPEFTSIGIIGSGTAGGWDADQNLTQDANNNHLWTGTFTFTDGEAKFRANDAWTNNWGANTYPSGTGTQDGANIPVKAGTYFVRFNDATGEYAFIASNRSAPYSSLGIIGSATPGGWDSDTDFVQNPSDPYLWSKLITLVDGEAKFRADDAWTVNWGSAIFPSGTATQDGANIPILAGTYFVTFNSGTGEYSFLK
jgi:hypothetical protein